MNRIKEFSILLLFFIIGAGLSCSKDIMNRTDNAPALSPANTDANAGTWKPILLTSPSEFAVAAPIAVTSPEYVLQVNEIKSWLRFGFSCF